MRLTEYVHLCLETRLKNGDSVLDATAGNGYDTLKAAELVQPDGNVVAIDIQKQAIEATGAKLAKAKLSHICKLHLGNHGEHLSHINQSFDCILFNLGYLPGSDKMIITTANDTLSALDQSQRLLKENGTLFVTAYRLHEGGQHEANAVEKWMHQQNANGGDIEKLEPGHQSNISSPVLWIASKKTLTLHPFPNNCL